jgi:phosphoribosylanthranilate isomerase
MTPTRTPRVKICCIASVDEAALAIECGASALGLVSHMPSGPGVIGDELIAEIVATAPPAIGTFLLTSRQRVTDIIVQQRFCRTNTIQICDNLAVGTYRDLKDALPGISIVQVIHVTGPESVEEAARIAPHVDGILLDSGNQKLAVKELGGTGRTHDWTSVAPSGSVSISLCSWPEGSLQKTLARPSKRWARSGWMYVPGCEPMASWTRSS